MAAKPGHVDGFTEFTAETEPVRDLHVALGRDGEYIEGKVVDGDGKPMAGVMVGVSGRASQQAPTVPFSTDPRRSMLETCSGEDGSFRAGPFPKGVARLLAAHSNHDPEWSNVIVTPGQPEVTIRFAKR